MSRWKRPPYVMAAEQARRQLENWRARNPDIVEAWTMADKEPTNAEYLRDLAERLMRVPVMYGTDQGDCYRLYEIARELETLEQYAVEAALSEFPKDE